MRTPWVVLALCILTTAATLSPLGAEPPVEVETGQSPTSGPEGAPIEIVEFFDFRCGHCVRMEPVIGALRTKYGDRLRVVYKPYMRALVNDPEKARVDLSHRAAAAALSANLQGRFLRMKKILLANSPYFRPEDLEKYAREADLDVERFLKDLESPEILEEVDATRNQAVRLRVSQTPTFFINGHRIEGLRSQSEMEKAVAEFAGITSDDQSTTAEVDLGPRWDQLIYQPGDMAPRTAKTKLKPGDRAPDFTLPAVTGEKVSLADFRNHKSVVISFVPAAFTPVCSGQWPEYGKRYEEVKSRDAVLLGITADNIPSLYAWLRGMPEIEFPVLSDFWPHGAVADDYGVLRPESGMTERATFVIDREGIVQFAKVHDIQENPELDEFLEVLDTLATGGGVSPEPERKGLLGIFGGR